MNQSRPIEGFETKVVGVTTGTDGYGYEAIAGSRHRRHHRRPAAQAGHEPDGPAGDQRQDRPRRSPRTSSKHSPDAVVIVVSNPLDEMTALAADRLRLPEEPGDRPGRACSTPPGSPTSSPRSSAVPVGVGDDADPRLARRHDGAGAVGAARSTASRWPTLLPADKIERAGRPDPQRRRRGRRAAQDRLGVLRPVRRRGPDGPRGRRGHRRGHAGLRLGRRRVRHLRRLPRRRGRDRRGRRAAGSSSAT